MTRTVGTQPTLQTASTSSTRDRSAPSPPFRRLRGSGAERLRTSATVPSRQRDATTAHRACRDDPHGRHPAHPADGLDRLDQRPASPSPPCRGFEAQAQSAFAPQPPCRADSGTQPPLIEPVEMTRTVGTQPTLRTVSTSSTSDRLVPARGQPASRSPATQVPATSAGPARAKALARASSGESAWRSATSRVDPARGSQPERVELLADREVADRRPTGRARRRRRRWRGAAGAGGQLVALAAEQLLGEVGLQPLLEQRETGAGADVGAERRPGRRGRGASRAGTGRCRGRRWTSGSARPRRRAGPSSSSSCSVGCTLCASTLRGPSSPARSYDVV